MFIEVKKGVLINVDNIISFQYYNADDDINKFTIEAILKDCEGIINDDLNKNHRTVYIAENIDKKKFEQFLKVFDVVSFK